MELNKKIKIGLTEKKLRELGLWEKAKQNAINCYGINYFNRVILKEDWKLLRMFVWKETTEGFDFWKNIEVKHNI